VTEVIEIPGADNIHVARVLGENVIVSKSVQVGYTGVFFPAETQLSEEYCKQNNLYRKAELNANPEKTGFFDENRRVRAQPFLKVKSQAYFAGIESLDYLLDSTLTDSNFLSLGQTFDVTLLQSKIVQSKRRLILHHTSKSMLIVHNSSTMLA
jgi:hypothetical protein